LYIINEFQIQGGNKMSKKVRHNLARNSKANSKFGLLKFDAEGFLTEPDLTEEQIEEICEIPNFERVVEEDEERQEDGQEDQKDENADEDSSEEEEQQEDEADEEDEVVDFEELIKEFAEKEGIELEENSFDSLTVKQLKAFAFNHDIEIEKTRKDEIIDEIVKALS
jgi:hypothetical protein